jgi:hypothetical protein
MGTDAHDVHFAARYVHTGLLRATKPALADAVIELSAASQRRSAFFAPLPPKPPTARSDASAQASEERRPTDENTLALAPSRLGPRAPRASTCSSTSSGSPGTRAASAQTGPRWPSVGALAGVKGPRVSAPGAERASALCGLLRARHYGRPPHRPGGELSELAHTRAGVLVAVVVTKHAMRAALRAMRSAAGAARARRARRVARRLAPSEGNHRHSAMYLGHALARLHAHAAHAHSAAVVARAADGARAPRQTLSRLCWQAWRASAAVHAAAVRAGRRGAQLRALRARFRLWRAASATRRRASHTLEAERSLVAFLLLCAHATARAAASSALWRGGRAALSRALARAAAGAARCGAAQAGRTERRARACAMHRRRALQALRAASRALRAADASFAPRVAALVRGVRWRRAQRGLRALGRAAATAASASAVGRAAVGARRALLEQRLRPALALWRGTRARARALASVGTPATLIQALGAWRARRARLRALHGWLVARRLWHARRRGLRAFVRAWRLRC